MAGRVFENTGHDANVDAIDIPGLLDMYRLNRIDILKLDVEGAEAEILGSSAETWIGAVNMVVVECHGDAIETKVTKALNEWGFSGQRHRSLVSFRRLGGRSPSYNRGVGHANL